MKVTIIGLGLIGGSLGLRLRELGIEVVGWDASSDHLEEASSMGIIDSKSESLLSSIQGAKWIFLAIPVHEIERILPGLLDELDEDQCVVDLGSTKQGIVDAVKDHPKRQLFLAAHPIAGTEYSGPAAALKDLFKGKNMIICDEEKTRNDFVTDFRELMRDIDLNVTSLSAEDHDKHLAFVSHLSHAIAFSLSQTVLEEEREDNRILDLAGSGFDSTVRLAKSSPEMWGPIFFHNKKRVLEAIDRFSEKLSQMRDQIESNSEEELDLFLNEARKIRKILK